MILRLLLPALGLLFAQILLAPAVAANTASEAADGGEALLSGSAPILEPSTLVLVGLGLIGLAVFRARYRHDED